MAYSKDSFGVLYTKFKLLLSRDAINLNISGETYNMLFSSLDGIYNLERRVLQRFNHVKEFSPLVFGIGNIFMEIEPWLQYYYIYITNFPVAIHTLDNLMKNYVFSNWIMVALLQYANSRII